MTSTAAPRSATASGKQSARIGRVPTAQDPLRVVVLHGDPTKTNDVLPGGKWDEDDFEVAARAKEAILQLGPQYKFQWLHNHDTLMDDLRALKKNNAVDLVLQVSSLSTSYSQTPTS